MKIGNLTVVFIIGYLITAFVYVYSYIGKMDSAYGINIQYGIVFPVIAFILNILAVLRIKKDEKLVKSLDRIR